MHRAMNCRKITLHFRFSGSTGKNFENENLKTTKVSVFLYSLSLLVLEKALKKDYFSVEQ